MKTYKHLFAKICSFENLLLAARRASRGKELTTPALKFFLHLEENLLQIQRELMAQTYQPGEYKTFEIVRPKCRMISAAPFRDRVVHHALCNVIAPLFERLSIFDSYANRVGKGTHAAIRRLQDFMRRTKCVLKCDLHQYFPSIDHEILKQIIREVIADAEALWLVDKIIDGSNAQAETNWYFPGDDLFALFQRRRISVFEMGQRVQSWLGHARQADTFRLRCRIFA